MSQCRQLKALDLNGCGNGNCDPDKSSVNNELGCGGDREQIPRLLRSQQQQQEEERQPKQQHVQRPNDCTSTNDANASTEIKCSERNKSHKSSHSNSKKSRSHLSSYESVSIGVLDGLVDRNLLVSNQHVEMLAIMFPYNFSCTQGEDMDTINATCMH